VKKEGRKERKKKKRDHLGTQEASRHAALRHPETMKNALDFTASFLS
jgi:hypothetical protein